MVLFTQLARHVGNSKQPNTTLRLILAKLPDIFNPAKALPGLLV